MATLDCVPLSYASPGLTPKKTLSTLDIPSLHRWAFNEYPQLPVGDCGGGAVFQTAVTRSERRRLGAPERRRDAADPAAETAALHHRSSRLMSSILVSPSASPTSISFPT